MQKKLLIVASIISLIAVLTSFSACASTQTSKPSSNVAANAVATQPIKLRVSINLAPKHPICETAVWWGQQVEEQTGGKVKVEVYTNGELYGHEDAIDAMVTGAIEMCSNAYSHWGGRDPFFKMGTLGWFFTSADQFKNNEQTLAKITDPLFQKQGAKVLNQWYNGESCYITREPVQDPTNLKGLMIRCESQASMDTMEALGASTCQMGAGEQYDALAKGSIDGAKTAFTSITTRHLEEVTKGYYGPMGYTPWANFISLKLWNSMPKDIQDKILEISKQAEVRCWEAGTNADKEIYAMLPKVGTLRLFTEAEMKDWSKRYMQPLYDKWIAESDKAGSGNEAREILAAVQGG